MRSSHKLKLSNNSSNPVLILLVCVLSVSLLNTNSSTNKVLHLLECIALKVHRVLAKRRESASLPTALPFFSFFDVYPLLLVTASL